MALHTIGTKAATSLPSLAAWSQVLASADLAAIGGSIVGDGMFGGTALGYTAGATAVIGTGSTHTSTTLDTLVGVSGLPLSQINIGDLILGPGIPAGTFVERLISSTSVLMSQAATASASINVAIVRKDAQPHLDQQGILTIPRRGFLKVLPGDYVAIDQAIGFPYLIPGNAVSVAGSIWTFT